METARSATVRGTTRYVFHYDLEDPDLCPKAAPGLAQLHKIPATFFVLGTVMEARGLELQHILGDDPRSGVDLGQKLVEEVFEQPCVRGGYGFYEGLRGERLKVIRDCGVRFLSSDLRGRPGDSIPGGLVGGVSFMMELPKYLSVFQRARRRSAVGSV